MLEESGGMESVVLEKHSWGAPDRAAEVLALGESVGVAPAVSEGHSRCGPV